MRGSQNIVLKGIFKQNGFLLGSTGGLGLCNPAEADTLPQGHQVPAITVSGCRGR